MPTRQSTPSTVDTAVQHTRFGGLDGLRAVAVLLVVVYHLFPRALPGGFLGVDIFFAISGFLITSLLMREYQQTGRIAFGSFWRRRARRLLPALALVVLVSTSLSLTASRDLLVGIGKQIGGAVLFVSNWVFIAGGTDYFERDTPELFRNFWSLALEEQFYIVLPLLLLALFKVRSKATRVIVLASLGVLSAALMVNYALSGADPTRVYFGSDSHSFGLLLGAAMAVLFYSPAPKPLSPGLNIASLSASVLGLGVLGVLAFTLAEASTESFAGGFQLATVAALIVIAAITREGAWAGRALDVQPLRWVGERSYGIYLWHWPLLLIFASLIKRLGLSEGAQWLTATATLSTTFVFAALSYRYIEQPVRKLGLRRALARWFAPHAYTKRQRNVAVSLTTALTVCFPLTGIAVAVAPERSSTAETIMRGQHLLEQHRTGPAEHDGDSRDDDAETDGTANNADASATGVTGDTGAAHAGEPPAEPVSANGSNITAVGDSVMLASYPELSASFPGIEVDAAVSRGLGEGVRIVSEIATAGTLRSVLVIGLGTNGPIDRSDLDALTQLAQTNKLILVNAHAERDWVPEVNTELEEFAAQHRGVVLADWDGAIARHPDFLAGDGIHPGPDGGEVYAGCIAAALEELATPSEAVGWQLPRR